MAIKIKAKQGSKLNPKNFKSREVKIRTPKGNISANLKGLSRRQRNEVVKAVAAKASGRSAVLVPQLLKSMSTTAATISTMITALEAAGNESDARKLRMILNAINDFTNHASKMSPAQLDALASVMKGNDWGTSTRPPKVPSSGTGDSGSGGNSNPSGSQGGTIIL